MPRGLPTVMAAVLLEGHGGFDRLRYRTDVPVPRPGPDEVLVRVAAAGVNNTDINTRIGWYSKTGGASDGGSWTGHVLKFPRIQGIDVCGTIVAIGEGVDGGRLGERVLIEPCLREAGGLVLNEPWFL